MTYPLFILGTIVLLGLLVVAEIAILRFVARRAGVTDEPIAVDEVAAEMTAAAQAQPADGGTSTQWRHHERSPERERRQPRETRA